MQPPSLRIRPWMPLALAALLVGCGGGDSRIDSGVDGGKTGAELEGEESEEICVAVLTYADDEVTTDDSCRLAGIGAGLEVWVAGLGSASDADIQAACSAEVSDCEADAGDDEAPDYELACSFGVAESFPGCTSTVDEIETCYADYVDETVALVRAQPACAELTGDYFLEILQGGGQTEPPAPESCQTVEENCEEAYELTGSLSGFL